MWKEVYPPIHLLMLPKDHLVVILISVLMAVVHDYASAFQMYSDLLILYCE